MVSALAPFWWVWSNPERTLRKHGLGNRFADQPLVEASLRLTIGRTYLRLGEAESAGPHLERAIELFRRMLGLEAQRTLEARHYYAEFLRQTGRSAEAISIHEQFLDVRQGLLGLSAGATLESINALAWALFSANSTNYARAEALFREAMARGKATLGETDPLVLRAKSGLAEIDYRAGTYEEYARYENEIFEARRKVLGPEHPDFLASAAARVVDLRHRLGDIHASEILGNGVLEKCRRVLGPDHWTVLVLVKKRAYASGPEACGVFQSKPGGSSCRARGGDMVKTTLRPSWQRITLVAACRP